MTIFKGQEVTLLGRHLQVGDQAPDATLVNPELQKVALSDYADKIRVISVVPSLDTGVCDQQTRRFNQDLGHSDQVEVLTVSVDLPFAQARWCGGSGLDHVTTLSDYYQHEFGMAYGVLMEEWHLLSRAVFVVDTQGKLVHVEYLENVHDHPDYEAVLKCVDELVKNS